MFYQWLECNDIIFQLVGRVSDTTATYTSNRDNDRVLFTYSNGVVTDPNGNLAATPAIAATDPMWETTAALKYLNWPENLYATINGVALKLDNIRAMLPRDYHYYWLYHDDDVAVGTTYIVHQPMLGQFQVFSWDDVLNSETYLVDASTTAP